jgi:L-rhamnose isomerase/sugar isomerase
MTTLTSERRAAVVDALAAQTIELPSWAFGNSGTRFKVFAQPGVPRDPYEKIADAAQVHAYTRVAPRVSLHIPWDRVDDCAKLAAYAADLGVRIGAINSNLFQDDEYRLGSLTHPDRAVLLAELRSGQGLDPDPMAAYAASGYAEKIVAERVGGRQAGWGA